MSRAAALAVALLVAAGAGAQERAASDEPLFTGRDAWIGAGFVVTTIAMLPLDRRIARTLRDSSVQANRFARHASKNVELITSPGAYIIGGTLYGVGRVTGKRRLADLGLHGTEAIFLAMETTGLIKGLAGRGRPSQVGDDRPHDFRLGRGFGGRHGYTSFPSGHTTKAFAAAAAVTAESARWRPGSAWVVGPLMYGGATLVGVSRIYHDAHWASDIVLGAAIGTFAGVKVVRYHHTHPRNRIDRWLLGATAAPLGEGRIAVGQRLTFR